MGVGQEIESRKKRVGERFQASQSSCSEGKEKGEVESEKEN